MAEQEIPTTTPESEADHDTESKPIQPNEPPKPPQNKQTKIRPRYLPSAPGLLAVPMDIVITMTMQFLITLTCILVIFSSATINRDDIVYCIIAEVIFTFVGFGYFTRKINNNILVYEKFYQRISEWTDYKYKKLKQSDSHWSLLWMALLFIFYWMYLIVIFPVVILWSMYHSYKWYQDRRKKRHTQESQWNLLISNRKEFWRVAERTYNTWHLGVLAKQASMMSIFLQDLPFLIISGIIGNKLGVAVFPIVICLKILFWIKHCFDLRKVTFFYRSRDFLAHFGMWGIKWDPETKLIIPEYMTERQYELATLQKGDWILVYVGKDGYSKEIALNDESNWKVVWIYEVKNFKIEGRPNLVCIDMNAVPEERFNDYVAGKTKKLQVPEDCFHEYDRWQSGQYITLLPDEWWDKYHNEESVKDQVERPETDTRDGSGLQSDDTIEVEVDGTANEVTEVEIENNEDNNEEIDPEKHVLIDSGIATNKEDVDQDNRGKVARSGKYESVPLNDEDEYE